MHYFYFHINLAVKVTRCILSERIGMCLVPLCWGGGTGTGSHLTVHNLDRLPYLVSARKYWCGKDSLGEQFYPASLRHSVALQVNKLSLRLIMFCCFGDLVK